MLSSECLFCVDFKVSAQCSAVSVYCT
uniref:Uncharacterized protein n=1 Tax=Anguilla anguilla TaxID=7936 RepID=A0A0E9ST92_ANGAN